MNERLGVVEFFTMEATEYLERLDVLVSSGSSPDLRELQRLTRALRGAAIMANQDPIAGAAGGFEQLARALKDGARQWDDATRQLAVRAVDDLKIFVRRVREWSDADTAKAQELTQALETALGRAPRPATPRPAASGPDSGTRAFIAREGAALATALDRAAKALARNPAAREPVEQVLDVMQPLRGLAGLGDLPPMPDLLAGIEQAVGEIARAAEPRAQAGQVFDAAAKALTEVTRAVASHGKADPDAPAVRHFAGLLETVLGFDEPVVPIESLYHEDGGPHIVEQGTLPASRDRLGDVELVSHGEHLRSVADGLDRADSATQRQLRVQALAGTFRALERGVGGPLADAATAFAQAGRNAVARGLAAAEPAAFAQMLREASTVLAGAAGGDHADLAEALEAVTHQLDQAAPGAVPPPARRTPPAAPRRPMAPSAAAVKPPRTTPPQSGGGEGGEGGEEAAAGLAATYRTYEQLVQAHGLEGGSIEELLSGPPAVPASHASHAPPASAAEALIPITDLCYRGDAALERALSLRPEIDAALKAGRNATALIEEVLDLVALGREPEA